MKINVNNMKRFAAASLVVLQVATLAGCKTTINEDVVYTEPNKQEAIYDVVDSRDYDTIYANTEKKENEEANEIIKGVIESALEDDVKKAMIETEIRTEIVEPLATVPVTEATEAVEQPVVEDAEEKDLFDTFEDLTKDVKADELNQQIKDFREQHMEEIYDVTNPEYHDIHVQYGALIYKRLVNAGIPEETILAELNNVILEQQVPRCVDEEQWNKDFGNIVSVLGEYESMYESYFCLAYLVHDEMCELEHEYNEFYAITCDNLEEGFQKKYNLK